MASLWASSGLLMNTSSSASPTSSCYHRKPAPINAAINLPGLPNLKISAPRQQNVISYTDDRQTRLLESLRQQTASPSSSSPSSPQLSPSSKQLLFSKLYMILEAVSDRVEMHKNVGEQRNNWNTLLLESINMMTLTATIMTGLAAACSEMHSGINMSSFVLFTAATGMNVIINKIQPSQLVEEQRNATRLFKRLEREIMTLIAIGKPRKADVKSLMDKVLALDRAYPLPLLGAMIEKFPSEFNPATWWPKKNDSEKRSESNGWSAELETEMRNIVRVLKTKDSEDYERLGNVALKLNKVLAVSGPTLTGIAALASAFAGSQSQIGSVAAAAAMVGGALACAVNSLEHGGQVGMVAEMYRNCAGLFKEMEESIEATVADRSENGEVFEMKVALKLGRSVSELRNLAQKSSSCGRDGTAVDEFASKLF